VVRRQAGVVLYVLGMVGVVVGVDVLFLRHQFWERLIVNVAIVVVFVLFYLRFLKSSSAGPRR
jgi:membrane protein implicated in regulation of membrane protease activity